MPLSEVGLCLNEMGLEVCPGFFVLVPPGPTVFWVLSCIDHHQPPTTVVIDIATRDGFVNNNTRKWKSRAIDMLFYWVRDRVRQGHYLVYWERGKDNLTDYFTKHHPTKHHRPIRGTYLVPTADSSKHACYQVPIDIRGCVKSPTSPGNG